MASQLTVLYKQSSQIYLHFNTLDSHTPRVSWLVQVGLDGMADCLSLRENLAQAPGAQDIPKGGLCQQSCGVAGVFHVGDRHCCIVYLVVDHSINSNCYTIFGQDLKVKQNVKVCYNFMTNC